MRYSLLSYIIITTIVLNVLHPTSQDIHIAHICFIFIGFLSLAHIHHDFNTYNEIKEVAKDLMKKEKERFLLYSEEEKADYLKWATMDAYLSYMKKHYSEEAIYERNKIRMSIYYILMRSHVY